MKKLGKITISPEKIMKNEELINLKGGYDGGGGKCGWNPDTGEKIYCGYSKDDVYGWWLEWGGYWCCDTPSTYCPSCG